MAAVAAPETVAFEDFLAREKTKDLLRFSTAGSVDDGKSTLIGRLLYDSRSVYEDQLESVTKASVGRNAGTIDFSLLTDGLRAEREQGITIDVAYRYFATPRRKFIIADTPGHEQYTRNMVTGSSTAELAIVLVDARKGLLPQSRRHAYIASLLGLPNVVIAVNKMDLVGYDQSVFARIETDFRRFLARLHAIEPYFIPISALEGDNVVAPSRHMPWFRGPALLDHLESVPTRNRELLMPFRFPVQRVVRPTLDFRGYAGTIVSGSVRVGDSVAILPSGRTTTVSGIVTFDGNLPSAHAGQSITLTFADEVDVSRGDTILSPDSPAELTNTFDATLVWLNDKPSELNRRYRLKHASREESAELTQLQSRININTLDRDPALNLEMNAIGLVRIETARPMVFDAYLENRSTGSFILIDPVTNATVAAGMISGPAARSLSPSNLVHHLAKPEAPVTSSDRVARWRHGGAVVRFGGRADLAWRVERLLFDKGFAAFLLPELDPATAVSLAASGFLVLITGNAQQGFSLNAAQSNASTNVALPSNDQDAIVAIERALERLHIVSAGSNFSESGGI